MIRYYETLLFHGIHFCELILFQDRYMAVGLQVGRTSLKNKYPTFGRTSLNKESKKARCRRHPLIGAGVDNKVCS